MKKIKKSMKSLLVVVVICIAYQINVFLLIICTVTAGLLHLVFLKEEQKRKKNRNRFDDVVLYMEQMVYSFKKQPKIRPALTDAAKVSSDCMKEIIEEAVVNIDSKMSEDIYEESLNIIQEEYDCKRLRSLHKFLIKIEKHGGEYKTYIDILLNDIKNWSDRVLLFIKDVERVKRNVLISIASTLLTCGFMAYLIPKEYRYTGHPLYQICSAVMILLMLISYLLVVKKLNFNWICEQSPLSDNMIMKYYVLAEKGYDNAKSFSMLEKMTYKKAKKTLEREILKAFPDWIREVAINLQNDTVQSAIENSYESAEFVLKRPIRKLLIDFEKYPVGIEPYENFLKEFDLRDIKSSMKMFYSINELGKEESAQQMNSIIDRNNKMMMRSEEMKNKDKIGAAGMFTAIPMILGVVKIMTDMILMILVFTSSISGVLNGG